MKTPWCIIKVRLKSDHGKSPGGRLIAERRVSGSSPHGEAPRERLSDATAPTSAPTNGVRRCRAPSTNRMLRFREFASASLSAVTAERSASLDERG